jgi:hypothetical protein
MRDLPGLSVSKQYSHNNMGWYDPYKNKFALFLGHPSMNHSYREVISTILHEYKHYLQESIKYSDIFYEIQAKHPGKNHKEIRKLHPHEVKCIKFENKWKDICYEELKEQLHVKKHKNVNS